MATLTKKDLLEAIEDMPEDAEIYIDFETKYSILRCRMCKHWGKISYWGRL